MRISRLCDGCCDRDTIAVTLVIGRRDLPEAQTNPIGQQ